jgi:hypothetical protein
MKSKLTYISLFILLASVVSLAQEKPTAELTGAYQFLRLDSVNVPVGWNASANISANKWFGVVGDFGGATKSELGVTTTLYTFGGGPQFTLRSRNVEPYFRLVFGAAHLTASGYGLSGSTTAFLIAPGGGADFRISGHLWLRLGANYPVARKNGVTLDGIQTVVGLTYKFGGRRETAGQATTQPAAAHESTRIASSGTPASTRPSSATITSNNAVSLLGVVLDSNMRIIRFLPDSVLSNRGLELGDVINSIDDKDVKTAEELTSAIFPRAKGTQVKIGYLRRGWWQTWIYIQL